MQLSVRDRTLAVSTVRCHCGKLAGPCVRYAVQFVSFALTSAAGAEYLALFTRDAALAAYKLGSSRVRDHGVTID